MNSSFDQLSASTAALAAEASGRLFHVPSPIGGKSALSFDGRRLLVPSREAAKGEEVAVIAPGGAAALTKVIGFDPALGFAVLELAQPLPATAWKAADSMPPLGSLLLAVAFPSEEGPELRLDLVRIASGKADDEESYIQTDGAPFPGFAGAALVAGSGQLVGVIAADRSGNHGWAIPALRAQALVDRIVARGFPSRAWLGLSSLPVEVPEAWKPLLDGAVEAVMVAAVESGSPAAAAGLLPGDIVVSLAGTRIASPEALREAILRLAPGTAVALSVLRGGAKLELTVTPKEGAEEAGSGEGPAGHHHGHRHHGGHHHGHGPQGESGGGDCGCGESGCGCSTGR